MIKCYQLNCHKSNEANIHLNNVYKEQKSSLSSVFLCQEPGHNKGTIKDFDNSLICHTGDDINPRACILVSKQLNAIKLNQFSNQDQVAILITDVNRTIVFASVYMPYNSNEPPPPALMQDLVSCCESRKWGLVIGSDVNSHNTIWGSTDSNLRGEYLLYYLLTTELYICNKGEVPTFLNAIREEVIDLTIASSNIEQDIVDWKVNTEDASSDHRMIEFNLVLKKKPRNKPFRNIKRTRWDEYRAKLSELLPEVDREQTDIDEYAKELSSKIKQAYEDSCPVTWGKRQSSYTWWTKELTELKRKAARLRKVYRKTGTEKALEAADKAKKEYRRIMKITKLEAWKKFCKEMEEKNETAKLQSLMKKGKVNQIGTLRRKDGTYTETPKETLRELLDSLFPDDEDFVKQDNRYTNINNNLTEEQIVKIVNKTTVETAMKSFKPFKSPGEDGIYPIMIQQGIELLEPYITPLFRESLRQGRPAEEWTRIKAVFIPKPGKTDYTNPKSFRPISLSSFMLKGLERLILWHMQSTTLMKKPLNSNVFSYNEGMSTETALHKVVHKIEKAMATDKFAVAVFLDISGAFSNTSIESLIRDLAETGVEQEILDWTAYLLSNRKTRATLGDDEAEKEVTNGMMEGGIKSPCNWNIKLSKCADKFPKNGPLDFTGYADDIGLLITGIDMQTLVDILQKAMKILEQWATENKLTFNADKTKAMIFTNKRKYRRPTLKINGKEIEYVTEFKYLGVILDNKLSWTKHVEAQTKKAKATIFMTRKMVGKDWGINPKTVKWLYTTTVRPILAYGALVWVGSLQRAEIISKLQKVQRMALLMMTRAMASTPTAGMETLLGLMPIECFLKKEALAAGLRLIHNGQWRARTGEELKETAHTVIIDRWRKKLEHADLPQDKLITKVRLIADFETEIKERDKIDKSTTKPMPLEENTISCFTDGSKSDIGTGAGYSIMGATTTVQESAYLGELTTVYQAEIAAITNACITLLDQEVENKRINFHIDNQSAIKSLGEYITRNKTTLECKQLLNKLAKVGNKIKLNWVPGHEGHMGNEVADRLAKDGAGRPTHHPGPWVPVSKCLIKEQINKWCDVLCEETWRNRPHCRQSKLVLPTTEHRWKNVENRTKKDIRIVTQIVTGHANLKYHRYLMKLEDNPRCDCGEEKETSTHVIAECPIYIMERQYYFGKPFIKIEEIYKQDLWQILGFAKQTKKWR